ncbi:MAG TPA: FMN-binding protein [Acidimicrobiales bacterium]|nr:FMN-binding protein [Acidimicrobiales bacterium]
MRRSPFVIVATAAGLYGVLSYQSHQPKLGLASGSSPTTSTPTTSTPATSTPAGSGTTAAGPTAPSTTAPRPATRSATGSLVQYGYGQLAVRVTLDGTRITDVSLASIQVAEQTSQYIAQQSVPVLRNEVLSAQNARIQAVSGATYTSEAYIRSLQSALSRAGA